MTSFFNLKLFLTISLSLLVTCLVSVQGAGRIVGGTATTLAGNEHIVSIRKDGIVSAGGSLVSPLHVVTCSHGLPGVTADRLIVHGGSAFLNGNTIRRGVQAIYMHPKYTADFHFDIAVLKLKRELTGANIKLVPLCTKPIYLGDTLRVSGWGKVEENGINIPNQLRTVKVKVISTEKCAADYANFKPVTNTMMCATSPGKDACYGDSGGPALLNGELCGVVSWGRGCNQINSPGVYTAVNVVRNFIKNAMLK